MTARINLCQTRRTYSEVSHGEKTVFTIAAPEEIDALNAASVAAHLRVLAAMIETHFGRGA